MFSSLTLRASFGTLEQLTGGYERFRGFKEPVSATNSSSVMRSTSGVHKHGIAVVNLHLPLDDTRLIRRVDPCRAAPVGELVASILVPPVTEPLCWHPVPMPHRSGDIPASLAQAKA
jgi:hypothetical protein